MSGVERDGRVAQGERGGGCGREGGEREGRGKKKEERREEIGEREERERGDQDMSGVLE